MKHNLAKTILTLIAVKLLFTRRNGSTALRKVDAPVHLAGYSDGKHIELVCGDWVEPKWGTPEEQRTEDSEVYVADDDRLYTFTESKASCSKCIIIDVVG